MTSRTAYIQQPPDSAGFATPQSPGYFIPAPRPFPSAPGLGGANGRWKTLILHASTIIDSNTGLLLVAASQFFFSVMNLAVKKLNSIDLPVPALEVFHRLSK